MAQQFNKYLSSVNTKDDDIGPQFVIRTNCQMPKILFFEVKIKRILYAMNGKGSSRVDGVSIKLLKNLVNKIAHPLLRIFQTSYITSAVPDDWRLANVSLIYKGAGSRCQTDNFCPISLTSVV